MEKKKYKQPEIRSIVLDEALLTDNSFIEVVPDGEAGSKRTYGTFDFESEE
ncbi:MAG: hypothetical protein KBT34_00680 [Prevotella sp.]|nr:hypothetical protein [Candidatus Prevotella equi]